MSSVRCAAGVLAAMCLAGSAHATPRLQLYIEGAQYDSASESWLTPASSFILWVVGSAQPSDLNKGITEILDVKLAAAFATGETGSMTLAPIQSGLLCGTTLCDQSGAEAAPIATAYSPSNDGQVPIKGDGTPLASHGVYGPGTSFFEWRLGDFDLQAGDAVGDYQYSFPTSFSQTGQISAYQVSVSGFSWVHFDAYNHTVTNGNEAKYVFAPFSHDAGVVPEPGTLVLLGGGLLALGLHRRARPARG